MSRSVVLARSQLILDTIGGEWVAAAPPACAGACNNFPGPPLAEVAGRDLARSERMQYRVFSPNQLETEQQGGIAGGTELT